jgi:predicted deacylase
MSFTQGFGRRKNLAAALSLATFVLATGPGRAADEEWTPLSVLGREVAPGTASKFPFIPDQSFEASYLNMPVFVARGARPGPTLCLTAGVHGDELNGVEIARRAFVRVDPVALRGTLIALPSINANGVRTGNRYLSDRRDLNRAFPGKEGGSVASLIAHAAFSRVLIHCDALVDLHTASNNRANLPQIRADIGNAAIRELAIHFGLGIVLAGEGPEASLRREAAKAGIAAIIYEAGEPYRFQQDEIDSGVQGVESVMAYLDMTEQEEREIPEARIYEKSSWVRAPVGQGGFFFPSANLGDVVDVGDPLGEIVDPLTDETYEVASPIRGEIVGMSVPQPVLSGYALFHLAWHESD